ncbi:hypothetical protein VB712_13980 [Spirulina sp. CCNP1310]|uniref:hypothetical protein n=1 Tax=Spirulina sp. CCNP1310 TaxID=3110249 RepID=UPI002B1F0618|nr:hypothetical protein [Spirulina sp. CCNP1310]MEA5420336.1 hypothetical protein [Spirulina sp. CCNP1310]
MATKIKTEKWVVTDTQGQRRIAVFRYRCHALIFLRGIQAVNARSPQRFDLTFCFPEGQEELDGKAWEEIL